MKANMINTNSIKTYLCAVVMLLGMSANAWGTASISGSITSKTIEVDDDHAEGYFTFTVSSSNVEADPQGKYLNVYLDPYTDSESFWFDCGFGTTSSQVGDGYFQSTSTSGTVGFYYHITEEGDYTTSIWVWGYENAGTYEAIYYEVPVTIKVHKSCTDRTVSFANATVTKNFGTAAGKYQDYTIDHSGGTVTWSSDDPTIASVNSSGVVTINKAGSTYINVNVANNGTYCEVEDYYEIEVNAVAPTLVTDVSDKEFEVSAITARGATFSGGVVTSKGNATITRYGFIIGTSSTVVVGGTGANAPVASGLWNADIDLNTAFGSKTAVSNFSPNTTYYARPFAYNGELYGYGTAVSFTTLNEYDITLDKNNSDVGSADGTATVVENATSIEIVAPTRTGYSVEGYYTTDGLETKVATAAGALQSGITVSATNWTDGSSRWVKAGDATFYTKWTANNYTVTFNQNGGSGGSDNVTATYNSAMPSATMPTTPPAVGKVFDGYYYNSVQYYDKDGKSVHVWDVASGATLTAAWTTATPTLTIASVGNVVISSTTPSLAEEGSTSVTYGNTVTLSHGDPESGYYWYDWNVYETGNESNTLTVTSNQFTMPNHDVTVSANLYTNLVFSCAELTLTKKLVTDGTPIFITSTAGKKVRSQDSILIVGSGLTPNQELEFDLPSQFEIKSRTGGTLAVGADGSINAVAYIFYTPDAGDTDLLTKLTGITVKVYGAKPIQKTLSHNIIGRRLPSRFVIAGKKNNKWYALPSTMSSTSTPDPSEIAVNDIDNPSVAYTAASNIYGLVGPTNTNISNGNGQYVRLTMSINDGNEPAGPAPLFGAGDAKIGKSGNSKATSDLSAGWWWALTQTNTSITNPQDAKYSIMCANSSNTLSIKNSPFVWGQYASGVEELRLIPASSIPFTEAYFVEWAQHGGVIEVDAEGIDATSVVAHLGAATSSPITLSQTLTSGKGRASKYNYTVNFGDGINFAADASNGAMLTLEWKKGETVKAMSNIVVPKIIASSATMSSIESGDAKWAQWEVHVLPGVKLTANAGDFSSNDVTIKHLEIYPGATVVVTKGAAESGILTATTLVLRNGWTRAGTKQFEKARLYITPSTATLKATNVYADWYVDYDQYYSISVPWEVTLSNVKYRYCSVSPTVGYDGNIRLRYYDGENRASTGQDQIGQNWKDYGKSGNKSVPTKLVPSMGYAMNAKRPTGKAFSIIRMPLTLPSGTWGAGTWTTNGEQGEVSSVHKNQVSVTGWGYGGSTPWYAMGWNFIGNPYMCEFSGDDSGITGQMELQNGGSIRYATIPDEGFKNYDQVNITSTALKPATGFFIQANNASEQTITFAGSKIVAPSAPAHYLTRTEAIPEQEAYIRLSYEGGKDQMGLIIGEDYTEAYEVNADLAKVLGDAGYVKTYMHYGNMDLAYVAINATLAQEWIPVTVILPTEGEYTYSLMSSSEVEQLEGVYLIDYTNNQITNLLENDYVFTAAAGTISDRFAINAIVGPRETPTDVDVINAGGDIHSNEPVKFIWNDKVFILHRGVIYDSTGKRVREINR